MHEHTYEHGTTNSAEQFLLMSSPRGTTNSTKLLPTHEFSAWHNNSAEQFLLMSSPRGTTKSTKLLPTHEFSAWHNNSAETLHVSNTDQLWLTDIDHRGDNSTFKASAKNRKPDIRV